MSEWMRERLNLLAAIDRHRDVFGAETHDYRLAAPLDESAIAAREEALGVALPSAYRAFLAEVGSVGAGPYYGLVDHAAHERWIASLRESDVAARSDAPFPFAAPHVPDPGARLDGLLYLSQQGCGHVSVLVLGGEAAGQVWTGYDFGLGGLTPEAPDFATWYARWLDDALYEWARSRLGPLALGPLEGTAEDDAVRRAIALVRPIVCARAELPDREPMQPGDALRALGNLCLLDGESDAADAAYDRAAAITAFDAEGRRRRDRARVRRARGRWREALEEAQLGLDSGTRHLGLSNDLHAERELALLGLHRHLEAIAAMELRAQDDTNHLQLHHRLARALCEVGDLHGAHAVLVRAVERSVGCYASAADIGASVMEGRGMPVPGLGQRLAEIYDPFVTSMRGPHPAIAGALAARRPG